MAFKKLYDRVKAGNKTFATLVKKIQKRTVEQAMKSLFLDRCNVNIFKWKFKTLSKFVNVKNPSPQFKEQAGKITLLEKIEDFINDKKGV